VNVYSYSNYVVIIALYKVLGGVARGQVQSEGEEEEGQATIPGQQNLATNRKQGGLL
jgi:hypothetical protein